MDAVEVLLQALRLVEVVRRIILLFLETIYKQYINDSPRIK